MNTNELSLKQAKALQDYLKNSSGLEITNVELLAGLTIYFIGMYLELIVDGLEKQQTK